MRTLPVIKHSHNPLEDAIRYHCCQLRRRSSFRDAERVNGSARTALRTWYPPTI